MTPLASSLLSPLPHICHGFFTRAGGVSEGIYASLNCGPGSGDALEKVMENRVRVERVMGAALITCRQVHGNRVVTVDQPWRREDAPEADAVVTKTSGIALGILTADCLPMLFADQKARIIGAAHAGWKGALNGVIEATLAAMRSLGAKDIAAAIGPAIAQASYEVGPEFPALFSPRLRGELEGGEQHNDNCNEKNHPHLTSPASGGGKSSDRLFIPSARSGHFLFDLKAYACERLRQDGVTHINVLERDTCLEENAFFSFRRATLRGERAYGRQVSAICLE